MSFSRRELLKGGRFSPPYISSSAHAQANRAAPPRLEYRTLGRTGLKVTTVGFGCMITSDPSVIEKAADLGINCFDTARLYQRGNNERMVGAALKRFRNRVHISSKTIADTKDGALRDLETSLSEIGTDHLDIWYLHDKRTPDGITDDLLEAQRIAKQQGKVRFTGVSAHTNQAAIMQKAVKSGMDAVLVGYNFAMDQGLEPALAETRKAGLGIVAMKVMAGGTRYASFYPTPDGVRARMKSEGAMLSALKWVLKNRDIAATIPSMVDSDQLDENMRAMSEPYGEADARMLAARFEEIRPIYCRMCGSCAGTCAKGLPVQDVLRSLMYAEGYGQFALGRENYLGIAERARGSRCRDCSACTVRCPNGVDVARRVARAQELFA